MVYMVVLSEEKNIIHILVQKRKVHMLSECKGFSSLY